MATSTPTDQAIRLIFEYDSSGIRLVSEQPVDVAVPPAQQVRSEEMRDGFWVEVRDPERAVLYRGAIRNPIERFPEVFSDQHEQSIVRVADPNPAGAFTVLVPLLATSDRVALISTAADDADVDAAPGRTRREARGIVD